MIVNDCGYCQMKTMPSGEDGIAIPLDRRHILGLIPQTKEAGSRKKRCLGPVIEHVTLPAGDHIHLNEAAGRNAQRFIFGPDEETIGRYVRWAG